MSANGGPEIGSPTSAVGLDGAQVALQMIQATTAAASAAQAAAHTLRRIQAQSATQDTDEKSWYKLLPRPGSFDPSTRESGVIGVGA